MLLSLVAGCSLAIWIYLLFFRGGFWREFAGVRGRLQSVGSAEGASPSGATRESLTPPSPSRRVVAVVPARDEADVVARTISSLAAQHWPADFHIVLVDDHSSDGTAEAARAAAPPEKLSIVPAEPLQPGWTGKLWAVAQGVDAAARFCPDYLLFTDADIVHEPGNLAVLVGRAEKDNYDLVSYMATLACGTPAEQWLIPAFVFFFFLLYPPAWISNPRRSTAGAAGGCVLIRYAMLEKIGGIAAIRGALIDDCSLAAAVKHAGGGVWLGLSDTTHSIRPYGTFAEVGKMISRSAFTQLRHSTLLLLGTIAGLAVTYIAPPVLTLLAPQPAAGMAAVAWLLMSICYLPALRFYRRPWFQAPLLPLVALFYAGATIDSAIAYWTGRGGQWKGRIQDVV